MTKRELEAQIFLSILPVMWESLDRIMPMSGCSEIQYDHIVVKRAEDFTELAISRLFSKKGKAHGRMASR